MMDGKLQWLLTLVFFLAGTVHCDASATKDCTKACAVLRQKLPGKVVTANDALSYQQSKDAYHTTFNSNLDPACFVSPTSAKDVSTIVKTARKFDCPFAAKSGSHTFFAGSSNIQDGITIDLKGLNEVSPNKKYPGTVSIGSGNRWGAVYDKLDPLNITVLGGRVDDVGVGGLLLSGGLSFYHPRLGLGCDSIRNYQVVDAGGKILEVNQQSYPDLYWALRGGGSNFGIVTRFDLDSVSYDRFWGGQIIYDISQLDVLIPAFAQIAKGEDLKATTWFVPFYSPKTNFWSIATQPMYSDPVPLNSPPKIFKPFVDAPKLVSTLRVDKLASFTREIDGTTITTQAEWSMTQRFNTDVIPYFIEQINQWNDIKDTSISGVAIDFQILSKQALSLTGKRGGNALGLSAKDGPLLNIHFQLGWQTNATAAESSAYVKMGEKIFADVERWGKSRGVASRYIYQNYAGPNQDVYGGYGAENLRRLKQVAGKYDPEGVFQKLMPGGLKLH